MTNTRYPEFSLDFYRLILHDHLFNIFGLIFFAVGAACVLVLWFLVRNRFKWGVFTLAVYLSEWPVFVIYLFENQHRGVYPPESDTIIIPIYQSYVAILFLLPIYFSILVLSLRAVSWSKQFWVLLVQPILGLIWLGYGFLGSCELIDGISDDHPFEIVQGFASILASLGIIWSLRSFYRKGLILPPP